jgi:hypothetical protein
MVSKKEFPPIYICNTHTSEQHRQVLTEDNYKDGLINIALISDPEGKLARALGLFLTEDTAIDSFTGEQKKLLFTEHIYLIGDNLKINDFICAAQMPHHEPGTAYDAELDSKKAVVDLVSKLRPESAKSVSSSFGLDKSTSGISIYYAHAELAARYAEARDELLKNYLANTPNGLIKLLPDDCDKIRFKCSDNSLLEKFFAKYSELGSDLTLDQGDYLLYIGSFGSNLHQKDLTNLLNDLSNAQKIAAQSSASMQKVIEDAKRTPLEAPPLKDEYSASRGPQSFMRISYE